MFCSSSHSGSTLPWKDRAKEVKKQRDSLSKICLINSPTTSWGSTASYSGATSSLVWMISDSSSSPGCAAASPVSSADEGSSTKEGSPGEMGFSFAVSAAAWGEGSAIFWIKQD